VPCFDLFQTIKAYIKYLLLNFTETFDFYFLVEHVDKPKIEYSGQMLIKLVIANIAARIRRTIPNVPLTTLVK